ncbi:MAG TPA: hypothetical protein VF735_10995 [Pyrinomonadaceae bacterium]
MISIFRKTTNTVIWLLLLFLAAEIPVQAQGIGDTYKTGQRREGSIVLPTPPFNPNAGILDRPKARSRTAPKARQRRRRVRRRTHRQS